MGLISRVKRLFTKKPTKESFVGFGTVPDPGLATNNWFRQWVGIFQLIDRAARMRGGNATERPLDERMLYIARGLMRYNTYAQGMVGALRNHTLGAQGLQYNVVGPSRAALLKYLDKWAETVDWWAWQREIYERVHIEGESITRFFPKDDGLVHLRPIEPELIVAPSGAIEWMFGFYNEPGDICDVTALNTLYDGETELVDATEWYHIKSKLSVRSEKRGRSDFLPVAQLLDDSFKTWRNFLQSEAVRQSVIYFAKQPQGVTTADLDQAIAADADYKPPSSGVGAGPGIKLQQGAGVEYIQDGTELLAAPAANAQGTMTGVNAGLLCIGRAYHIPLVLMSGDMSANNTLDFGDESPFGMTIQDEQSWFCRHVRRLFLQMIGIAVDEGFLPEAVLTDGTNIEIAAQRKQAQDADKNTTRAKTLYEDGVISALERSAMEGVDYEEQQAQRSREGLPTAVEIAKIRGFESSGGSGADKAPSGSGSRDNL